MVRGHLIRGDALARVRLAARDGVLPRSWLLPRERPVSRVRSGAVDCLQHCARQLGRLSDPIRGVDLEAVHQKAVAVIVVVEDPP